ncbi:MAG: hypothetical protein LJE89_06475 [Deltaproteobacteria bacterium]|nr:hypothetical protein [Deltaproteobacteria bacterium]
MNCCCQTAKMGVPARATTPAMRARRGGRANRHPQGVGPEAHLNGTSQGPRPEDARKDGHIRGRSRRIHEICGITVSEKIAMVF